MTARLLEHFKQKLQSLTLIPAGGGCFEIAVNGELIYSKLKTGEFPNEQLIIDEVMKRLN